MIRYDYPSFQDIASIKFTS